MAKKEDVLGLGAQFHAVKTENRIRSIELIELLGISHHTLQRLETGGPVYAWYAIKTAKEYNIPLRDFYSHIPGIDDLWLPGTSLLHEPEITYAATQRELELQRQLLACKQRVIDLQDEIRSLNGRN